MDFKKDYYTILEIKKDAGKEDIRASYRRLAKAYHPDRNPGDSAAEEKFKLANEAHEVLSNDILKDEYDQYRKKEEEWKEKQKKDDPASTISSTNKKTYQRTKTTTTETRIYVRGEIEIKYWADQEDEITSIFQNELRYKINPTEATVNIVETNIHSVQGIPLDYLRAFKESELFKSSIQQPVKCAVTTAEGQEHYELELVDMRIKNIRLEGVTKHEGQSFGVLKGDVYAYSPEFKSTEEIEEVTECFGETGNVERKTEAGISFYRKQYYNPDCTSYWGEWIRIKKTGAGAATKATAGVTATSWKEKSAFAEVSGCMQFWWIPVAIFLIVVYPQLIMVFLIVAAIWLLFSFGTMLLTAFRTLFSFLALILFGLFIISAIRSFSKKPMPIVKRDIPAYDSLRTTKAPLPAPNNSNRIQDTLISHFIRWKDYDSNAYEATLSISALDVRSSATDHNMLNPLFTSNSLRPAYLSLVEGDAGKLNRIYTAFDSIRTLKNLDEFGFARMLVSCVQSVPYFLVVDKSCNDNYDDEYTRNYLAACKTECCIGHEKFGVRSPAEFISDLKGDCDTRALFLYGLLKHYRYNVALITSDYYKHAMIAVNFSKGYGDGLAMNIRDKNYYLWETTTAGLNVGYIPSDLQNLDFWDIALLNENK